MNYLLFFLQQNYEALGVKSILISAIVGLAGAVVYLYKSKEDALKEKDKQIMAVIKEHQDDLKTENQTMQQLLEKYNSFTQSLKEMVKDGNR